MILAWAQPPPRTDTRADDLDYEDEVVPIAFFPPDLPKLDMSDDGFWWTRLELKRAVKTARRWLWPATEHDTNEPLAELAAA